MSRQFVVVGLRRLGISMLATLESLELEVLGIDEREDVIQVVADDLPNVNLVGADATNEDAMRGLNVGDFDAAAVMIGEDHVEAGILATATLKEVGVPRVVARATGGIHARVLERVGADRVILPEREIGEQLARTMGHRVARGGRARRGRLERGTGEILTRQAVRSLGERREARGEGDRGAGRAPHRR